MKFAARDWRMKLKNGWRSLKRRSVGIGGFLEPSEAEYVDRDRKSVV